MPLFLDQSSFPCYKATMMCTVLVACLLLVITTNTRLEINGVTTVFSDSTLLHGMLPSSSKKTLAPRPLQVLPPRIDIVPDSIDCNLLFDEDIKELKKAETLLQEVEIAIPTANVVSLRARNCSRLLDEGRYILSPVNEEERTFPLAFSVRLHKHVAQFERLLRSLYRPQNVYCIYIDKKAEDSIHQAVREIVKCFPNVFIAKQLRNFYYSSFSPVEADLQCMKELLKSSVPWKYYMNMAGQEFPLKTNHEMVRILQQMNGSNDIESYPFPPRYRDRIKSQYKVVNGAFVKTNVSKSAFKFPKGRMLRKGCSYNTFSRAFVEWIFKDKAAQDFIHWTKDTSAPDEIVWATLNYWPEAPGGYPFPITQLHKNFLSREIIWAYSKQPCFGKYVRLVCIVSVGELWWLSQRRELFINKLDLRFDPIAFGCLEKAILERTKWPGMSTGSKFDWGSIENLPQVRYRHKITNKKPLDDELKALIALKLPDNML